ncbi:MAG: hypothetical protein A3G34_03250 [Candidatus Lindowbacteria bacterium RIFCSPLOWO2_12_FULL_62_27]|nr:MAG: hypothetical protein A3I06_16020 [Candidatus Lindowbacteria bacterium RIFCSPLOWO2_02_FULL_62_12]OGH62966.1 MAG: hypothetical protein A3G34_03250 [Candidatus Lindowbacteria bacterium RIFCSPLOWO2_12_FULL_62_27]
MKEFSALFKSSIEGSFEDFSAQFLRHLRLLLGNVTRFEEVEDRQLEGIARELADPESITVLEHGEGGKTSDLLLLPLKLGSGRVRYVVAEGSLRHVNVDELHMLKWLYEIRLDTDARIQGFRAGAVYDCDQGILSRTAIRQIFEIEKSRAEDFGSGLGFLILRLRQDRFQEALETVRQHSRRTDYLFSLDAARTGEVLLLLVECSAFGSEAILQRLKKLLESRLLSSGYSIYPQQGETVDELMSEAEGALV